MDPDAHLETSYSFTNYRSRAEVGLRMHTGSAAYSGTMFDMGPRGRLSIGRCTMINVAWIICDEQIDIGDHVMISWNAVIMDSYRTSFDPMFRRRQLEQYWHDRTAPDVVASSRPIRIGNAAWIGFDAVVLPGVTIGDGSIVGARSVVSEDVPPYCIAVGNPARIVRRLDPAEAHHGRAAAS